MAAPPVDLSGLIDLHIHSAPDVVERHGDDIDIAREAQAAGMSAVMLKSHVTGTADRASIAGRMVAGIHVFGGLALNEEVGGLNPAAVDAAIKMGAKQIWMPSKDAAHSRMVKGGSGGISILNDAGDLLPSVLEILDLLAGTDLILGTGHISTRESSALVGQARRMGLRKILITHPESRSAWMSPRDQREIAGPGLFFERCYFSVLSGGAPISRIVANIRQIGVESTVLATDLGQNDQPSPVAGLRAYLTQLLDAGITESEITEMAAVIPARLLDLA